MTDERQARLRVRELPAVLEWLATDMEYAARRGTEDEDLERWRAAVRELRAALAAQVPAQEERMDVERWADELSLVIAKARFGPSVDMGGRHNPKPSEVTAARRFMEGVAANPSADPEYGAREYEKVRRALGDESKEGAG